MNDLKNINKYYSIDGRKHAIINCTPSFIFVELYHDDVIVGGIEVNINSMHYAESIAENFCNDILKINPWSTNESIESNICGANKS